MKEQDYPYLYKKANKLSIEHQKCYYMLMIAYLTLLFLGAFLSYFTPCKCLKIIAFIMYLCSLGIFVWQKIYNPRELWYNGRAVAESIKTMTGRWIMKAHPYNQLRGSVSEDFKADLKTILTDNESVFKHYEDCNDDDFYTITDEMRRVRVLSSRDKLAYYNSHRINEQLRWYRSKAKYNRRRYNIYFTINIILYIVILVFMALSIGDITAKYPIQILSLITVSIISWMEAKRYNELSNSYSLTVSDISLMREDKLTGQVSDQDVSDYVINCETAFSREHTQWFARKK